ncbi:MAG: hypothetical protein RLZZ308_594 [Candidatus Parcubacteria bacterium]|jgi:hypothetical protein
MKVYIASFEKHVGKIQEDIYIRNEFLSKSISSEILTLAEIVKKVEAQDIVMLKSIWGYHLDFKHFLGQLSALKEKNVILVNDHDYIYWNIDKSKYLPELIDIVNIVPTYIVSFNDAKTKEDVDGLIKITIKNDDNTVFVIKPAISASGYLTFVYTKGNNNDCVTDLLKHKDLDFIVQPFRAEINQGEISVISINGKINYGMIRFPGVIAEKNDSIYISISEIPDLLMNHTESILIFFKLKFKFLPKICRLDFIKNGQNFELIEVELIDPDLYFRYLPKELLKQCLQELCIT